MAQHNERKAKAIHKQRQAKRDAHVSKLKRGTVATNLQSMDNKAYKQAGKRNRMKPLRRVLSPGIRIVLQWVGGVASPILLQSQCAKL